MKPGSIKSDVHGPGQVHLDRTAPTEQVQQKAPTQTNVQQQIPEGKSQLPQGETSSVRSRGESQIVRQRAQQTAKRTGKRQKFLKVPTVKTLSKAARMAFKALAELLGKAKELLERFRRKTMDDDEGEQQKRRQQEELLPDADERKIDPSKVPRGILAT